MTDTTTITPEERASWRERLENPFSCHDAKSAAFTLRLLNALEAAEASKAEAEAENARLAAQLAALTGQQEDCKLHPCPYSREGLNCGVISLANNRAHEGMVENMRLTAERDWLVEKLADISDKMNRPGAPTFCAACNICPVGDDEMEGRTCAVAIAEAARRAVEGSSE